MRSSACRDDAAPPGAGVLGGLARNFKVDCREPCSSVELFLNRDAFKIFAARRPARRPPRPMRKHGRTTRAFSGVKLTSPAAEVGDQLKARGDRSPPSPRIFLGPTRPPAVAFSYIDALMGLRRRATSVTLTAPLQHSAGES